MHRAGLRVYEVLCGRHPSLRPWHFQWLVGRSLYRDLRRVLPMLHGDVLDLGCGDQPYRPWMDSQRVRTYVGADVTEGGRVDVVLRPGAAWPFADHSFDSILCTQVMEHVADLDFVMNELARVLRPGGLLIVSVPFVYNEHGIPYDFRRFSAYGVASRFASGYEPIELVRQGGIGSTLGMLLLNWFMIGRATRTMAGLLMPVWIVFCAIVNAGAVALDAFDRTNGFYANVLFVGRRRPAADPAIR